MNFQNKINDLIVEMIREGVSPQDISWLFNSSVTKHCDIIYRLDRELPTSREEGPSDYPDGDSIHVPGTNVVDLDRELDEYMSHEKGCICYNADNDCPICCDAGCNCKLDCCEQWYHQKCIQKWYYEHDSCPTCRTSLMMDDKGQIVKKVVTAKTRDFGHGTRPGVAPVNAGWVTNDEEYRNAPIRRAAPPPPRGPIGIPGPRGPSPYRADRFSSIPVPLPYTPIIPTVNIEDLYFEDLVEVGNHNSNQNSNDPEIHVRPIEGREGYFRSIDHGFVIKMERNGTLTVLFVDPNDDGDIRDLTEDEKRIATSLGLTISNTRRQYISGCDYVMMRGPYMGQRCNRPTENLPGVPGSDRYCRGCLNKTAVKRSLGLSV